MIPKSKKARNTVAGMVANTIVGLLALYINMTPELREGLLMIVAGGYIIIPSIFNYAQGQADAGSGGKTSANYKPIELQTLTTPIKSDVIPIEGGTVQLDKVADMFNKLNLKVTGSKQKPEDKGDLVDWKAED